MNFLISLLVMLVIGFQAQAQDSGKMMKKIPSKLSSSPQQDEKFYQWLKEAYGANQDNGFETLTMAEPKKLTASLKSLNCDIQTSALKGFLESKVFKYQFDTTAMIRELNQMKQLFCGPDCKALEARINQRKANIGRSKEIIVEIDKSCSKEKVNPTEIKKPLTPQQINQGATE